MSVVSTFHIDLSCLGLAASASRCHRIAATARTIRITATTSFFVVASAALVGWATIASTTTTDTATVDVVVAEGTCARATFLDHDLFTTNDKGVGGYNGIEGSLVDEFDEGTVLWSVMHHISERREPTLERLTSK